MTDKEFLKILDLIDNEDGIHTLDVIKRAVNHRLSIIVGE